VFLVDTNLLIYAANADSKFHATAAAWLERQRLRPDAWYVSWPIVFEFLRVATHRRALPHPWTLDKAWSFISALLASPGLSVLVATDRHPQVAAAVFAELPFLTGNILHDVHTAILMREHGIRRICTRDTDFHRFPFLEVVDPLVA
jgi:toxin-antitoxin system PIN domain toxin